MVGEKKWVPYVLLGPWIIGFILFKLYPFINSFIMSLYQRQGRNSVFVGFDNFVQIFNRADPVGEEFIASLGTTFLYVFVTVPLILIVSLFVAYVLALKLKGIGFFRTAFYIPTVLGTNVAIIIMAFHFPR